jgi:hypothetical protein
MYLDPRLLCSLLCNIRCTSVIDYSKLVYNIERVKFVRNINLPRN